MSDLSLSGLYDSPSRYLGDSFTPSIDGSFSLLLGDMGSDLFPLFIEHAFFGDTIPPVDGMLHNPSAASSSSSPEFSAPSSSLLPRTDRMMRASSELRQTDGLDHKPYELDGISSATESTGKGKRKTLGYCRAISCLFDAALPRARPEWVNTEDWKELVEEKKSGRLVRVLDINPKNPDIIILGFSELYDKVLHSMVVYGDSMARYTESLQGRHRYWSDKSILDFKVFNQRLANGTLSRTIELPPRLKNHRYLRHLAQTGDLNESQQAVKREFKAFVDGVINRVSDYSRQKILSEASKSGGVLHNDLKSVQEYVRQSEDECLSRWNQKLAEIEST